MQRLSVSPSISLEFKRKKESGTIFYVVGKLKNEHHQIIK